MSNKKDQLSNKVDFLKHYNISENNFEQADIKWEILQEIYSDYLSNSKDLEPTGTSVMEYIRKIKEVHSLKMRIKNPNNLIEKIIRKHIENPDREIILKNYREQITDLVGIRALHLFKNEWKPIHDFVTRTWDLQEQPIAYVREGDSKELRKNFEDSELKVVEQEYGYRSLHYILKLQPTKQPALVELQVRTLFEEGWSEIDHQTRYPYFKDDLLLSGYLDLINRLAGSADEMGSFLKYLIADRSAKDAALKAALSEKEAAVKEAKDAIAKSKATEAEKAKLIKIVEGLSPRKSLFTPPTTGLTFANILTRINSGTALPSDEGIPKAILPKKCDSCGEMYHPTDMSFLFSDKCPKCRTPPK